MTESSDVNGVSWAENITATLDALDDLRGRTRKGERAAKMR